MRLSNERLISLFARLRGQPSRHARLLNTFSLLEFIGFRKIVKSLAVSGLDSETLSHVREEIRHAAILKKEAVRIGGAAFDRYQPETLLAPEAARAYFNNLESACAKAAGDDTRTTYLLTTWLIEIRALQVYAAYTEAPAREESARLSSIFADEERHLASVERELRAKSGDAWIADLRAYEEKQALAFVSALEAEIAPREDLTHA